MRIFQLKELFCYVGLAIFLAAATTSPIAHGETGGADLLTTQREAEARAAIAEAERAELLVRLPPSTIKPLQGNIDTRQFGAAGLVKAFDLARELAAEVCAALPADRRTRSTSRRPRRASWPRARSSMPSSA